MAFRDDVETDLDNVFLDTAAFAEDITIKRADVTLPSISLKAVPEELVGFIDTKDNRIYRVASSDYPNPRENDKIIDSQGREWAILQIRIDTVGMTELRTISPLFTS